MPSIQNPILPGFYPDPSICRVGDDYYLTNSTFEYFPGLPIHHSKDLIHWTQIGNALDRPSQLDLKGLPSSGGLYAPTLRHWKGLFYLTCNNVGGKGNFIVTAKDPAGPWSEPLWMDDHGIDGDMFFDDDGKAYYTRQDGGEKGGIAQAQFDPKTGKLLTPFKKIWNDLSEVWNEGPHLYKIKGWYYLMLAEGGTGSNHMEVIGRSKSPSGPFEPSPHNPVLTNRDDPKNPIQCAGHADLVETPDGQWWLVHLGTRPEKGVSVLGRETFLQPVRWTEDGWPIAGVEHHAMLSYGEAPKAFAPRTVRVPFGQDKLDNAWIHVRNPRPGSVTLSAQGSLRLIGDATGLDDQGSPAFAGVRQQHFVMSARTQIDFMPSKPGEEAGLSVRANEDNHYETLLTHEGGKRVVQARVRAKGSTALLASRAVQAGPVILQLSASRDQYQFSYSQDGKSWVTLGAAEAAALSPERAGGFTGTVLGLYAVNASADFAWFETEAGKAPADIAISPRPTPTPPPPSDTWRIRCGASAVTDSAGRAWRKDIGYLGGQVTGANHPIAGTQDEALYQGERYDKDFSYALPVPAGSYQVTLKFAEIYWDKPGARLFSVFIDEKKVLDHFDIFVEAKGKDRAVDRVFKGVKPGADGMLRLRFVADFENAKVSAIEVVPQR